MGTRHNEDGKEDGDEAQRGWERGTTRMGTRHNEDGDEAQPVLAAKR